MDGGVVYKHKLPWGNKLLFRSVHRSQIMGAGRGPRAEGRGRGFSLTMIRSGT